MSSTHKLLVLEDEKNVGLTLVERLRKEGFEVVWVESAKAAAQAIETSRFDLALLDVGLPDGNGFEVAEKIRAKQAATSVIFLTAFGGPEDRIRGLELGAEDYVVKPFHLKELILRIRNGLKRSEYLRNGSQNSAGVAAVEPAQIGKAQVWLSRFELKSDGETHVLTHKEAAILSLLLEKRGMVVSREEILERGWSDSEFPTTRTIDNFILRLRRWVEPNPDSPEVIRSIRGVGYQLLADDTELR